VGVRTLDPEWLAAWCISMDKRLVETPCKHRSRPIMIELRERFGLNAVDACAAIREANLIRGKSA